MRASCSLSMHTGAFKPKAFISSLIVLFTLLLSPTLFLKEVKAQVYDGIAYQMYLVAQPDARSEAMGRGSSALSGSPFMSFYNPAISIFSRRMSFEVSHLELDYPLPFSHTNYDIYLAGANLGKNGSFTLGYLRTICLEDWWASAGPNSSDDERITLSTNIYLFNYAYPIIENFSAGININYFEDKFFWPGRHGWMFDLGLMRKFPFGSSIGSHAVSLGLSFNNLLNSKFVASSEYASYMPSIIRLGASYEFQPYIKISDFNFLKAVLCAEYFDLMNADFMTQYKFGAEVNILEMLKLRGGWFTKDIGDYPGSIGWLKEGTYGFGIELPVKKLTNLDLPLIVQFDYTSLPSERSNYSYILDKRNTPVYSLNLAYGI